MSQQLSNLNSSLSLRPSSSSSSSSTYDPNFTGGIKQWIQTDLQIEMLNQQLKLLRDKREKLGSGLAQYMQQRDLTKTAFNVDNNRVVFRNESKYSGLSYEYLFKCAEQYFNNRKQAQIFCDFVKEKRLKTTTPCLKRSISKPRKQAQNQR